MPSVLLSNTTNRTPSKRTRPPNVASHRYPSRVCRMSLTEFCGSPFSVVQESNLYCAVAFEADATRSATHTPTAGSSRQPCWRGSKAADGVSRSCALTGENSDERVDGCGHRHIASV